MLKVTHLPDRGVTILQHQTNFAGGKLDMGVLSLLRHELAEASRAPNDLAALSGLQFDIMDQGTRRDIAEGKGIAGFDVSRGAGNHLIPDPEVGWGKDVPLLAIDIMKKGDPGRRVGIVLNRRHLPGDLSFVPFEINLPETPLVTPPPVPAVNC